MDACEVEDQITIKFSYDDAISWQVLLVLTSCLQDFLSSGFFHDAHTIRLDCKSMFVNKHYEEKPVVAGAPWWRKIPLASGIFQLYDASHMIFCFLDHSLLKKNNDGVTSEKSNETLLRSTTMECSLLIVAIWWTRIQELTSGR